MASALVAVTLNKNNLRPGVLFGLAGLFPFISVGIGNLAGALALRLVGWALAGQYSSVV